MNARHDDIYVLLNIGSSYLSGMLATKSPQGRVRPLATHRLPTAGAVRHGCIHNIEESARIIGAIIDHLATELPEDASIQGVYLGIEARSMRSVRYEARLELDSQDNIVTDEHLKLLREQVKDASYPGMTVLSVSDPRYFCDRQREVTPRGVRCHTIEAHYLLIIARQNVIANIRDTIEGRLKLSILGFIPTPIAEATATLSIEERILGCAYINIGGGTTSIAIYRDRYPEALFILPLGGANVTLDLTQLPTPLLLEDAERLKIEKGSMDQSIARTQEIAFSPASGGAPKLFFQWDVNRFISTRILEILKNVLQIIDEAGYTDLIARGFIFAGGVTQTDHFYETLYKLTPDYRPASLRREIYEEGVPEALLQSYATEIALAFQAKEKGVIFEALPLSNLLHDTPPPSSTPPNPSPAPPSPQEEGASYKDETYTYPEEPKQDGASTGRLSEESQPQAAPPKRQASSEVSRFIKGIADLWGNVTGGKNDNEY